MKTDLQLQQDVIAELGKEPTVHTAQIGVEVRDGVVSLSGQVSSYIERCDAEAAALRVEGVQSLAVELEVQLGQFDWRDDADIARIAQAELESLAPPAGIIIKVMVEKGWLTLSGVVQREQQRVTAAHAMRNLIGVRGVTNLIGLEPGVVQAL